MPPSITDSVALIHHHDHNDHRNRLQRLATLAVLAMLGALCLPGTARAGITSVAGINGIYDKMLTMQPIALCKDDGSGCIQAPVDGGFLIQTFAQAGIATAILPSNTLNNSALRNANDGASSFAAAGLGQSTNVSTLNVWFANDAARGAYYGEVTGIGGNGAVIDATSVLAEGRQSTVAHELGHNLGLEHNTFGAGPVGNLMTAGDSRNPLASGLTAEQVAQMRLSPFVLDAPKINVSVDFTPGNYTIVTLKFASGPGDINLRHLSIDLPDYLLTQPEPEQRPAQFSTYGELLSSSVGGVSLSYGENMRNFFASDPDFIEPGHFDTTGGLPELELDFSAGFMLGDELQFAFGIDGDLRGEHFFQIERDLAGALADFTYDFGLSGRALLVDDPLQQASDFVSDAAQGAFAFAGPAGATVTTHTVYDSRRLVALLDTNANATPFGPQYGPGEAPPFLGTGDPEWRRTPSSVSEPPALAMLLMLALPALLRRRSGPHDAAAEPSLRS